MFKTICHFLFGGVENKSQGAAEEEEEEEEEEEGWHVVTHKEAQVAENPDVVKEKHHGETAVNLDTDADSVLKPQSSPPTSSSSSSSSTSGQLQLLLFSSQPRAPAEITQLTCVQKAKAWTHRHHESRNAFQRQNRVRGGVQTQPFHVQQPSHRHHGH